GACKGQFRPADHTLYLRDDGDANWRGGYAPGTDFTLDDSQCQLLGIGSVASVSGNSITLTLPLSFKPAFYGAKAVYMMATDNYNVTSALQQKGSWTATEPPTVFGLTPNPATGMSQSLTASFSDPLGGASGIS